MMKKTKVFIVIFLFTGMTCLAQQLSNQVMLPAAGLATAGVLSYSQTIGETAVEIINNSGFILTQGFQQPGIIAPALTAHSGTGVDVYPNPVTDFINIKLFSDKAHKIKIELISLNGEINNSMTLDFPSEYYYVQQIQVTRLIIGFYFVRVRSEDGVINRIFKIEKM
jgi:hypothetical protein